MYSRQVCNYGWSYILWIKLSFSLSTLAMNKCDSQTTKESKHVSTRRKAANLRDIWAAFGGDATVWVGLIGSHRARSGSHWICFSSSSGAHMAWWWHRRPTRRGLLRYTHAVQAQVSTLHWRVIRLDWLMLLWLGRWNTFYYFTYRYHIISTLVMV